MFCKSLPSLQETLQEVLCSQTLPLCRAEQKPCVTPNVELIGIVLKSMSTGGRFAPFSPPAHVSIPPLDQPFRDREGFADAMVLDFMPFYVVLPAPRSNLQISLVGPVATCFLM